MSNKNNFQKRQNLFDLSRSSQIVAPSILSANFSKMGEELKAIEAAGAHWVHIDVMDGHFVPNLTFGPPVIRKFRNESDLFFDVHLMIEKPELSIKDYIEAGADLITIHVEATDKQNEILAQLNSHNIKKGMSLRPGTPIENLEPYLGSLDLVLVMTVEPGFGGQSFMEEQVQKIDWLKGQRQKNGYSYIIEVDGGVNKSTVQKCKGADVLVAGSFVFKHTEGYLAALNDLGC